MPDGPGIALALHPAQPADAPAMAAILNAGIDEARPGDALPGRPDVRTLLFRVLS